MYNTKIVMVLKLLKLKLLEYLKDEIAKMVNIRFKINNTYYFYLFLLIQ